MAGWSPDGEVTEALEVTGTASASACTGTRRRVTTPA